MIYTKLSLLDAMAIHVGCTYLSDLHYINEHQRLQLARALETVPAIDEDLFDWNDALAYILGVNTPCSSAKQAKYTLIAALSSPHS